MKIISAGTRNLCTIGNVPYGAAFHAKEGYYIKMEPSPVLPGKHIHHGVSLETGHLTDFSGNTYVELVDATIYLGDRQ